MLNTIRPISLVAVLKGFLFTGVTLWAVTATVLLFRLRPVPVLIGIDPYGVRVISSENDRLLKIERLNFVKRYLSYAYSYAASDYETRISHAGDMMSKTLWDDKKSEFQRIKLSLKDQELTQDLKILEIREVDPDTFEADLKINVKTRLQEAGTALRVQLKLKRAQRTAENPYQYEVDSYVEQVLSL